MRSENYSAMVEYAKQKTLRREKEVIKTIEQMKQENVTINFSTVAQYSKASKSFLYRNEKISGVIRANRGF